MKKFEYKTEMIAFGIPTAEELDDFEQRLKKLGSKGWRMVSISKDVYLFERELVEKAVHCFQCGGLHSISSATVAFVCPRCSWLNHKWPNAKGGKQEAYKKEARENFADYCDEY